MISSLSQLETRIARLPKNRATRHRMADLILQRWPAGLRSAYRASMRKCYSAMAGGNPDAARDAFIAAALDVATVRKP